MSLLFFTCESCEVPAPLSLEFFEQWQQERSSQGRQHVLTEFLYQCSRFEFDQSNFTQSDQARLLSVSAPEAGLFLSAYPRSENVFSSEEFQVACCLRLGLPLKCIPATLKCNCENKPFVGEDGNHFHSCGKGGDRHGRHEDLVRILGSLASSAGFKTTREPSGIFASDYSNRRPDHYIQGFNLDNKGRDAITDVSVTHPCNITNLQRGSHANAGKSADLRFNDKTIHYQTLADNHLYDLVPLIFETYGRWHGTVSGFVDHTCSHIATRRSIPRSALIKYWRQRISVSLARANAAMIIGRVVNICKEDYTGTSTDGDSSSDEDLPHHYDITTR